MSTSAGLRMASSGLTAIPRTRTANDDHKDFHRILLDGCSTTRWCAAQARRRGCGISRRRYAFRCRTAPSRPPRSLISRMASPVARLLRPRAGTVACRSAATQRRVGRHDAGQDIHGLDTVSRLRDRRVGCPTVKAKLHVTCPSGKRRAVRVHAGATVLLEVGSGTVAVQRDGEPDTSPGDGLTPLFGARCLSTGCSISAGAIGR